MRRPARSAYPHPWFRLAGVAGAVLVGIGLAAPLTTASAAPAAAIHLGPPFSGTVVASAGLPSTPCARASDPIPPYLNLSSGHGGVALRVEAASCRSLRTPSAGHPETEATASASAWINGTLPVRVSPARFTVYVNFTWGEVALLTQRVGTCAPLAYVLRNASGVTDWGCASEDSFGVENTAELVDLTTGQIVGRASTYLGFYGEQENYTWCTNASSCVFGEWAGWGFAGTGGVSFNWQSPFYANQTARVSLVVTPTGPLAVGHRYAVAWNWTVTTEANWWEYNALLRHASVRLALSAAPGTLRGLRLDRIVVT